MTGVFACPECGQELAVEGLSPGREILCDGCSTWVEVPYLPRAVTRQSRRSIERSPWNSWLLKGAIGFAVVALLGLVTTWTIDRRIRSGKEKVLAELVASADEAEANRRFDAAYYHIEAALAQARKMGLERSSRLGELKERRDRISVLEVESRLEAIDALDPDSAVGEALTLAKRASTDPALESLATTIETKLAGLRLRRVEADLSSARKAFDDGRDAEAFATAARLLDHAGDLPRSDASAFQTEASTILETTVARKGVALPPVTGRFVVGSAEAYTKVLDRPRADYLRSKGYFPEPRNSPWSALWAEKAPFRLMVEVVETQEELYLQSKNRTTQVIGTFYLLRGDRSIWNRPVSAKTRVPLPDIPAMLGGHLATSDKRNPEAERRFHDDAMKQFVEQALKNLRGLPAREVAIKIP
jgi:hypothetical protein